MDLMHADPALADAIVQMFIDLQDNLLFGSDTVKPVNSPQYHQSLMTGAPLLAEIVRRDIERAGGVDKLTEKNSAAFKILRGNYDAAMETAYARVYRWKVSQGVNPARMDARKANLDGPRAALHAMCFEHSLQLRPDWVVPTLIFGLIARIKPHQKSFPNHDRLLL